jgi:hypothetical protein
MSYPSAFRTPPGEAAFLAAYDTVPVLNVPPQLHAEDGAVLVAWLTHFLWIDALSVELVHACDVPAAKRTAEAEHLGTGPDGHG